MPFQNPKRSDVGRRRGPSTGSETRVSRVRRVPAEGLGTSGAPSTPGRTPVPDLSTRPGSSSRYGRVTPLTLSAQDLRMSQQAANSRSEPAPSNRSKRVTPSMDSSTTRRITCLHSLVWIGLAHTRRTVRLRTMDAVASWCKNSRFTVATCKLPLGKDDGWTPTCLRGINLHA